MNKAKVSVINSHVFSSDDFEPGSPVYKALFRKGITDTASITYIDRLSDMQNFPPVHRSTIKMRTSRVGEYYAWWVVSWQVEGSAIQDLIWILTKDYTHVPPNYQPKDEEGFFLVYDHQNILFTQPIAKHSLNSSIAFKNKTNILVKTNLSVTPQGGTATYDFKTM